MVSKTVRVLIVEDDLIQTLLLEKFFQKIGYKIVGKADSGRDAIELATRLKPDLITMDIMLVDDIDGIMAAKEIQKTIKTNLVYISGNRDEDILKRASETDFIGFFQKPFNMRELESFLTDEQLIKLS